MQPERKQVGFTVVELLIVMVIASILAAIAAPSFSRFIGDTRMATTYNLLTSDLNRARLEAIKRNSWMLICVRNASGDGCGTGVDWKNGWVVCADSEPNNICDPATADEPNPVVVRQAINTKLTLTGSAEIIRFNPNGTQGSGMVATVTLCCNSNSSSSTARIAATGYITK